MSNVQQLCSLNMHRNRHNGAKFQMFDEYFPSQFLQTKQRSNTIFEIPDLHKCCHKRGIWKLLMKNLIQYTQFINTLAMELTTLSV